MKILYFHQHFTTPAGAGGTRSFEFARRLARRGHEVVVVCGSYGGGATGLTGPFERGFRRGSVDGFEVVEYALPYSNRLSFLKRAWLFLRYAGFCCGFALREPADLVFATSTPLTAALPGIVARWLKRRPFVFEVRDLWPELPKAMGVIRNPLVLSALGALEWLAYQSADHTVALSPGILRGIARRGVRQDRIAFLPNAADTDTFTPERAERWEGNQSADALVALFAGTHGIANGLEGILDAAEELQRRGRTDIEFLLVGDGNRKDSLVARARQRGLRHVHFLDPLPKEKLAPLVAGADVGIMSLANVPAFYYGTSPNKFFDYLAAGLPVVVNHPGWVADLLDKNGCGLFADPAQPHTLADALERLASQPQLRREMGRRGRALAESEFSRDRIAEDFAITLEGVQQRWPHLKHQGLLPRTIKRAFDFGGALTLGILLGPLLLLLGAAVALRLGRPILFSQKRPGRFGHLFAMTKFRTMNNARDRTGALLPDELRLTRFGNALRSTSLDELPELWNVLRGEMSLVGPRPLLPEYLSLYSAEQSKRHGVRPGITGWAQVHGRNAIDWETRLALDTWYSDHWSLGLDARILWKTVATVLSRKGIHAEGFVTMPKFTGTPDKEPTL